MAVRLKVMDRRPFAGGHEFGAAGVYERITGQAHFTVNPDEPIVDLDRAPRDDAGLVRCAADFMLLVPASGNRRLFFDYGNRGHKRALQFFNDAPHSNDPLTLAHAGNGFLFRHVSEAVPQARELDSAGHFIPPLVICLQVLSAVARVCADKESIRSLDEIQRCVRRRHPLSGRRGHSGLTDRLRTGL